MKYEITKEQILNLHGNAKNFGCSSVEFSLKEWFPEAFKPVLEVGKWYFVERPEEEFGDEKIALIFYENKNDLYGFDHGGTWINHYGNPKNDKYTFTEASESEVFEALKNEAVKRGYKKGICIIDLYPGLSQKEFLSSNNFDWELIPVKTETWELRDSYGNVIFLNGKWSEIIETITKEEAEKLLNKKII